MKTYNTLFEAMLEAADACQTWESPREPGVTYNVTELSEIACIHDMNFPLQSDTQQYAAFPDGEICLINFETQLVNLLYRPLQQVQQPTEQPVQQPVYQQHIQQPAQQPVYQQPVQQPVYQQPVQQPIYQQPIQQQAYQQPVQQPTYQQPVQQPTYQQPVQQTIQQPVRQPAQQPVKPVSVASTLWTFCPECGHKLSGQSNACENCGMPLR